MKRNPHWDETITEDIGFQGPHFNAPSWSPEEEYGMHGEGHGWESKKVLPDPDIPGSWRGGNEGWGNYPADEFTGIQSNVPSGGGFLRNIFEKFGGTMPGLVFDTPYRLTPEEKFIQKQQRDLQKENFKDYYYNQYKPGPWNEFDPPSPLPYPHSEYGSGDLMALNIGDTFPLEGLGRKRPYGGTLDLGPQYEELETIPLDLQFDQWGNPIGNDDYGYFNDIFAARGGLI